MLVALLVPLLMKLLIKLSNREIENVLITFTEHKAKLYEHFVKLHCSRKVPYQHTLLINYSFDAIIDAESTRLIFVFISHI